MKVLLFSGLLLVSTLFPAVTDCDSIQLDLQVTHTSDGNNDGKIEVSVEKGQAPFKVYLFADKRSDNLLDVKFKDLKNLKAGNYLLLVQDSGGECTYRQNVIIN